ncbi:DUF2291 family protein [Poseidonocella sedimentorum]|uniref:Predicted lipoprotein n=1 Tax=Poseidonocella sedimentorum TaxID=871652 RepID=A0A1I6DHW9_9RHOB|nr:DUF2291 domain-containing protein [Poseidonocella sedimentorum]SFR04981.1 Predicted lipoprotein [Poseidonocella sedimentorum]
MIRFLALALALVLCGVAALSGCQIVFEDENAPAEIPAGPDGDDARNTARLEESFEAELLPLVAQRALDLEGLRTALSAGLDSAGEAHANRGAGQGAAWNFALRDEGRVVANRLDSSARTADVDVDGDGESDLRLQLGPVIRGTALRDAAPFYNFDDFRDQIEFAKLARAINDRIKPALVAVEDVPVGATVRFTGVVPLKAADGDLVVTPIDFEVVE